MQTPATYENWYIGFDIWGGMDPVTGYPYLRSLGRTKSVSEASPSPFSSKAPILASSVIVPRAFVSGRHLVITAPSGVGVQVRFIDLRGRTAAVHRSTGSARVSLTAVPAGRYILELRDVAGRQRLGVERVVVR